MEEDSDLPITSSQDSAIDEPDPDELPVRVEALAAIISLEPSDAQDQPAYPVVITVAVEEAEVNNPVAAEELPASSDILKAKPPFVQNIVNMVSTQVSEFVAALFSEDPNDQDTSFCAVQNFDLLHFLNSPAFKDFLTETEDNYCDNVMGCHGSVKGEECSSETSKTSDSSSIVEASGELGSASGSKQNSDEAIEGVTPKQPGQDDDKDKAPGPDTEDVGKPVEDENEDENEDAAS